MKPYKLLWYTILLIVLLTLIDPKSSLSIQMHATYFVMRTYDFTLLFTIILSVTGGLYWLLRNSRLINWLSYLHIFLTVVCCLVFIMLCLKQTYFALSSELQSSSTSGTLSIASFFTLLFAQILLFINAIQALLRHK